MCCYIYADVHFHTNKRCIIVHGLDHIYIHWHTATKHGVRTKQMNCEESDLDKYTLWALYRFAYTTLP